MAGGPLADVVPCMHCFEEARREREGMETDWYRCVNGHTFGIDWSHEGPAKERGWPPSPEQRALFEKVRAARGG